MASSHGHPGAALLAPRLAGALLVAAALTLASLDAPAASAALTDEVRPVVPEAGSVAEAATGALPDLPVPVEIPDPPKAPAPPSSPPKPPPAAPPPAPSGTEATAPRSSGGAGVVPEAEGFSALPAPAPDNSKPSRGVAQRSGRASIGRAEAAPFYRLRAYVWPAIALRLRVALAPLGSLDDFVGGAPVPDVLELLSPTTLSGVIGDNWTP